MAGRALGQHFLIDQSVAGRIAEATEVNSADVVLEVGPGRGSLTGRLLPSARKIIAVELDEQLVGELEGRFQGDPRLRIVHGDILKVDWEDFVSESEGKLIVASNLPYQITSPFIFKMLDYRSNIARAILMVQKEVGERLAAFPGCKDYGIPSVALQLYSKVEILFHVGRRAFRPVPKVDSAVVRIDFSFPHPRLPKDESLFLDLVKSAFGHRRKMLRNSLLSGQLASRLGNTLNPVLLESAASGVNLNLDRRAETLSVEEFVELSDAVYEQIGG